MSIRRATMWGAALGLAALGALSIPEYPRERLSSRPFTSTRILARDGELLYEQRSEIGGYGRWVALDEVSPELVLATLSGEDAGFYGHFGIDPDGVARAAVLNLREGRLAYGGSSITQQLAKLLDPQPRDLGGKLVEATHAIRLERTLGKNEILEQYLNRAYYGRLAYGVEAASQRFFGKPAADLDLDEAALLAVLPRGPTAYDPDRNPDAALRRRAHVLAVMADRGWIDREAAEGAAAKPIRLVDARQDPQARHLLDHLQVSGRIVPGEAEVRTTLDLELQRALEARVRMHLLDVRDRAASQAGIVVIDNASGEVIAMVGSRRYGEREVHGAVNATTAARHPGSALKPFVYALALERGADPGTPILDVPTEWPDYRPRNVSGVHRGIVSYREALGSSLNVPAVRLAQEVGVGDLVELLRASGLDTIDPDVSEHGLPLALGASPVRLVDLASAYAMLARGGTWRSPAFVLDEPSEERRVLSLETAHLITDMLMDPRARQAEFGVETPLDLPFDVAVKTGTSQSFCDNVVVGYTGDVTVAVWVGNFDGEPMQGLLSMDGAAPLFRDAMLAAMDERSRGGPVAPRTISERRVCALSGMTAGAHCPHRRVELVAERHRDDTPCDWHDSTGVAVPAEAHAHGYGDRSLPPRAGQSPIAILAPANGAVFAIDPLLASQRVPLRAAVALPNVERVRWEIDGVAVAETHAPFRASFAPEPGTHVLRATAIAGEETVSTEIEIHVRGAIRAEGAGGPRNTRDRSEGT